MYPQTGAFLRLLSLSTSHIRQNNNASTFDKIDIKLSLEFRKQSRCEETESGEKTENICCE